jgi:hypothetical protein
LGVSDAKGELKNIYPIVDGMWKGREFSYRFLELYIAAEVASIIALLVEFLDSTKWPGLHDGAFASLEKSLVQIL